MFKQEYYTYKKLELPIKKIIDNEITTSNVNLLIKIHHLLKRSYNNRFWFRINAIHESCWDEGHDKYLKIIENKIDDCYDMLWDRFEAKVDTIIDEYSDSSDEGNPRERVRIPDFPQIASRPNRQEIQSKMIQSGSKGAISPARNKENVEIKEDPVDTVRKVIPEADLEFINWLNELSTILVGIPNLEILVNSSLIEFNIKYYRPRWTYNLKPSYLGAKYILFFKDLTKYLWSIYKSHRRNGSVIYRVYKRDVNIFALTFIVSDTPKIVYIKKEDGDFNFNFWVINYNEEIKDPKLINYHDSFKVWKFRVTQDENSLKDLFANLSIMYDYNDKKEQYYSIKIFVNAVFAKINELNINSADVEF